VVTAAPFAESAMSPLLQHPPPRPPRASEEQELSEEEGLDRAVLMTGHGSMVGW